MLEVKDFVKFIIIVQEFYLRFLCILLQNCVCLINNMY